MVVCAGVGDSPKETGCCNAAKEVIEGVTHREGMGVEQLPIGLGDIEGCTERRDLPVQVCRSQQPWVTGTIEDVNAAVETPPVPNPLTYVDLEDSSHAKGSTMNFEKQDRASPSADHQMDAAPIHGTSMSTEQKDEGDGVVDDPGIMVEGLQGEGGRAGDTDGRENLRDSGARDTGLVHGAGKARIRGRGFQNMLCVGFAVAMCLNFGSMTALQQGFFAAEVACLPPGASETVLRDLGMWVGWRRAVANADTHVSFNLEELSSVGFAMGILTISGHATDAVVNVLGIALLLRARRKPAEERLSRAVKRACWASLAMAGWLSGLTMTGFLIAVKGPIGSAAVKFYSQQFELSCKSEVSVSIDYAYAMTTLAVLCQIFIGLVAIPNPVRWFPVFSRRRRDSIASTSSATPGVVELEGSAAGTAAAASASDSKRPPSRSRSSVSRESVDGRRRSSSSRERDGRNSWGRRGMRVKGKKNGLEPNMLRTTTCDPV